MATHASATDAAMLPPSPLLAAVATVCSTSAACAPLDHVARLIDAFLDPSPQRSLQQAVRSGSVRLLHRVLFHQRGDVNVDRFLWQLRIRTAIDDAAARGELAMVELLHANHPDFLASRILSLAAARGDLKMIQWIKTHRYDESIANIPASLVVAAEHGHFEVVRYLMESYDTSTTPVYCPSSALQEATENGHLHIAKYLSSRGVRSKFQGAGDVAARNGHLHAVQYLHAMDLPNVFTSAAIPGAAGAGHLEIVRFLHENRTEESCGSVAMNSAASGGFLDVVQFLHANRTECCSEYAVIGAAKNGHLRVIQWLHVHLPLTVSRGIVPATVAALAHRQDAVLAWLESAFGCMPAPPANAAETVALAGDVAGLAKLQELHGSTTVKWPQRVLEIAASDGHVEMIQWLHEHRPDMHSVDAMDLAAENGHFEVVQLLHEYGMSQCTPWTLAMAAASGDLAMVHWLDTHYAAVSNFQEAMDEAARHGRLELVIWLHTNRLEGCTTRALDMAAASGHWEVVQWLVHNRSEEATQHGMDDAATYHHLKIVSLLHDRYGLTMSEGSDISSASAGALSALQWEYRVQPETVDLVQCRRAAAQNGHFHVVDWINDTIGRRRRRRTGL